MTDLDAHAQALRALHVPGNPVVLANAWDAITASVVAESGASAIATSSIAVARARGYPDNDTMPPDVAFDAVATVARAVSLPVTADIEAGYRLPADELVRRLLAAGAVGCNIEDSDHHGDGVLMPVAAQAERLASIRAAATKAGVPIVLNARIDLFIRNPKDHAGQLDEAIARGRAYLAAGADSVFPIFLGDEALIAKFVEGVGGNVNITLRPGAPDVAALAKLGVARISLGGGLFNTAVTAVRERAKELYG
jgi:2-methylisocitrate lyase-like PEP mutase family enzyme